MMPGWVVQANQVPTKRAAAASRCHVVTKRRQHAFKITGLTWIVERSFAWLGRNRRLSKDYESRVQTAELQFD
jgi:transposase